MYLLCFSLLAAAYRDAYTTLWAKIIYYHYFYEKIWHKSGCDSGLLPEFLQGEERECGIVMKWFQCHQSSATKSTIRSLGGARWRCRTQRELVCFCFTCSASLAASSGETMSLKGTHTSIFFLFIYLFLSLINDKVLTHLLTLYVKQQHE